MEQLGKLTAGVVLLILSFITRGVAISYSWNWFVVKQFNTSQLSIINAIGLSILVVLIMGMKNKKNEHTFNESMGRRIAFNLVGLLFAFITSLFI